MLYDSMTLLNNLDLRGPIAFLELDRTRFFLVGLSLQNDISNAVVKKSRRKTLGIPGRKKRDKDTDSV